MKDIASYALEEMVKAGAEKASCSATQGRTDEYNVEANEFTLLRTLFSDSLTLNFIKDGRKGTISVNKLDKDSVKKAVADCAALAAVGQQDEAHDVAEKIENKDFDQTMGGADMSALFSRTKEFIEQARAEFPTIGLRQIVSKFTGAKTAYMNSKGAAFGRETENYLMSGGFSASEGEKTSSFNYYGASLSSLDKPFLDLGMYRALVEEATRSVNTRAVDGKFVGKMIVTPACEDLIWHTIIGCFLSTAPLIEGTSLWKDSLGKQVADPRLTFRAAPLHPGIVCGERYTADGYESRDFDYIKDGVLKSFALGLYGANKTGKPRSANTEFDALDVAPGDAALADMIAGVDRGILVNRFSGAQPGPSGEVSGIAKNSFLIEGGKVAGALGETMISFNILDALKNITAISKERASNGGSVLPWCCFDGITVSGK